MTDYKVTEAKYVGHRTIWPAGSHGDVGYWLLQGPSKRWMMACPRCGEVVGLYDHEVTIEDGSIPAGIALVTISPSVGHTSCKAHYFVRKNKIQVLGDMA